MIEPAPSIDGRTLEHESSGAFVICVTAPAAVTVKISIARSSFWPVRLQSESNATRLPFFHRKISTLPSGLAPVRLQLDSNAILLPSALMLGRVLEQPAADVSW